MIGTLDKMHEKAKEAGFEYVRASDDEWVECTKEQAEQLLSDLLRIRVEIDDV